MRKLIRGIAAGMTILAVAACSGDASNERADEIRSMAAEASLAELQTKLHADGLLRIPEVKAKSDEFIQAYRSGATTKEAAGKEFLIWLEQWVKENPELAQSAKVQAAQNAAARQAVSSDSN